MSSESPSTGSVDDQAEPSAALAFQETNSVNSSTGESDELDERVYERVLEFEREYPELAKLPLSTQHGRKLRRIVTEAEWTDEWVEPDEPTERAFTVTELERRSAATWAEAVSCFLSAHVDYEGLTGIFSNQDGETIEVPFSDAWGEEYNKKQYARAQALQRQIGGGERPSGCESVPEWEDPVTVMLTLTSSSKPDSERVPPVDHLDRIHNSWSYDGVRDALRNTLEYHLDLDSDQWGYWLQAEPHGLGEDPGMNACYTHVHVGVYLDFSPISCSAHELGGEMERVIEKHLSVCDGATIAGHDYRSIEDYTDSEGCISVNTNVADLGCYLAAYMGGYTEDLLEKPIQYIAWGAIYWAAARRRTSRSVTVNHAIRADACQQRAESDSSNQSVDHGTDVIWNDHHGADVVCPCCESGFGINQDRLDEPISDVDVGNDQQSEQEQEAKSLSEMSLAERWPSASNAASVGESIVHTRIRKRVNQFLRAHSVPDPSVAFVLGKLNIDPSQENFVREIMEGQTNTPRDTYNNESQELGGNWELTAIVDGDGEEHTPGEGGVDMKPLHLPMECIVENTRLQHERKKGEHVYCQKCNVALPGGEDHRTYAAHFAFDHGFTQPRVVESFLEITDHYDLGRSCMRRPSE
jgi:hypothetical protein